MNTPSLSPLLIDVREACRLLSVGKTKFYELANDPENELAIIKIDKRSLLHHADVEQFAARLRDQAHGSSGRTSSSARKFPVPEGLRPSPQSQVGSNRGRNSNSATRRVKKLPRPQADEDGRARSSTAGSREPMKKRKIVKKRTRK